VLEGRLRGGDQNAFLADKVLAKCPSKFEGQGQAAADGGTRS
jgi:cytochrome c-type biogenesis protein CcmE